uniref:Transcription factor Pcc1 n=1 Tax=Thermofilum pendens TaxID=2269 RepID=A0A7C4B972_THEPE
MLQVEIEISGVEPAILDALYAAFKPESEPTPRHRSGIEVIREPSLALRIIIRSRDISSLRASLNSVLRALGAICASMKVVSQQHPAAASDLEYG